MRNCIAHLLTAVVVTCTAASSARAEPVKISFENPPCAQVFDDVGNPVFYPSNCYFGLGAIFSSEGGPFGGVSAFAIAADPTATSPPNVARPLAGFPTLHAEFFQPIRPGAFGPFGTNAVSFHITGSVSGQSPWEVVLFGMESNLAVFRGISDQLVSFQRGRAVDGVGVFQGEIFGFTVRGGTALQGIDNLTFNGVEAAATPEPATLLLMGTAAFALARNRRRFKTARRPSVPTRYPQH